MSPEFNEAIDSIIGRLKIIDADHYSQDGVVRENLSRLNRFIKVRQGFPEIVGPLAQAIYDNHYTRQDEGRGSYRYVPDRLLSQYHIETLSSGIANDKSILPGWRLLEAQGDGKVSVADENGNQRTVRAEEFLPDESGKTGSLQLPAAAPYIQQGWFHLRGAKDHSTKDGTTIRIYFNVCRSGAVPLLQTLARSMNSSGVPFHFKILDDPQNFRRADAAVLYFAGSDWSRAVGAIVGIHDSVGRYLKAATPLFSKRLAPGIGLAEDPGQGDSFGMNRSRLTAEGMWLAHQESKTTDVDVKTVIARHFEANGIKVEKTHLNPGSPGDYPIHLPEQLRTLRSVIEVLP